MATITTTTTTTKTDIPSPAALRASLHRDGFVIIRSILPESQLLALRAAAQRTTSLARSGGWPHVRTVGKQFPPWTFDPDVGIWGVQGLLNPALGEDSRIFARSYFCDEILGVAKELMSSDSSGGSSDSGDDDQEAGGQCRDEDLVMELYNMLVRPDFKDFELRWHRDDIPPTASDEEEMDRLRQPEWHTQWNLALWDGDESLVVVPGSHARARTREEREAGEFEVGLKGELRVRLDAGDVVFYNNNILHRGVYWTGKERMSLHGSVGHVKGGRLRARNVLQHGVGEWVEQVDFEGVFEEDGKEEGRLRARAEEMRGKLVKLGRESGDVGYSLTG